MTRRPFLLGLSTAALVPLLAACQPEASGPGPRRPVVEVVEVRPTRLDRTVTLTGTIAARTETALSFRTSGRIVERLVDVGDRVRKGQVLARLDTETQAADVQSARAGVAAADAQVRQATAAFDRSKALLAQGFTTRRDFDQADRTLKVAVAAAESARAQLASAEEAMTYTDLAADADGIVTQRLLDVGETAQAAATVFTIAWDGPRDALFDIYEGLLLDQTAGEPATIAASLVSDPTVATSGRVRQIAPSVDARTGTVRVKIGLDDVPAAMTLGAAVSGTGTVASAEVVVVPPAALTTAGGRPAVWVFDPASGVVTPRPVAVRSYRTDAVVVDSGLEAGDRVVVGGTTLLRPGEAVAVAEETASR